MSHTPARVAMGLTVGPACPLPTGEVGMSRPRLPLGRLQNGPGRSQGSFRPPGPEHRAQGVTCPCQQWTIGTTPRVDTRPPPKACHSLYQQRSYLPRATPCQVTGSPHLSAPLAIHHKGRAEGPGAWLSSHERCRLDVQLHMEPPWPVRPGHCPRSLALCSPAGLGARLQDGQPRGWLRPW